MRTALLVVISSLFLFSSTSFAQLNEWQEDYSTGTKLMGEGKLSLAVEYLVRAAAGAVADIGTDNRDVAVIYYNIGILYNKMNVQTRAVINLKKSIDILEKILPENDPELAEFMTDLADLYYEQGDSFAALDLYSRICAIYAEKNTISEAHAKALNRTAMIYTALDDSENAGDFMIRSLHVLEEQYGNDSIELIPCLKDIAMLYTMIDSIDNSIETQERIISILAANPEITSADELIAAHKNIGELQKNAGNMDAANRHYRESFILSRNVYGLSSYETDSALDEYYEFRKSIGWSSIRYEDLPRMVLTAAAGYFSTPDASIGKKYRLRPRFEGQLSYRFYRNYCLYYSAGTLSSEMFEKYYTVVDYYNELDEHTIGSKYKLISNNIGLKFHINEFFDVENSANWITAGVSIIDSKKTERIKYKTVEIINGNEMTVQREKDRLDLSNGTGFFFELGHSITHPNFFLKNMTMGVSFGVRYEFCRFQGSDIGGFTLFAGTSFLIY